MFFPKYKLVEPFDPPREHQHKFSNTSPFFHPWDCKAVTFIHMIQNLYQWAENAGLDASPVLHWQLYLTTSLKQQRIYRAWVSSEQNHMPLLWQSPVLPGNDLPNCLLGEQDLAPLRRGFHSNNQDYTKQALMHRISTLTSKALAIECMGSKYKTHEELDGN